MGNLKVRINDIVVKPIEFDIKPETRSMFIKRQATYSLRFICDTKTLDKLWGLQGHECEYEIDNDHYSTAFKGEHKVISYSLSPISRNEMEMLIYKEELWKP